MESPPSCHPKCRAGCFSLSTAHQLPQTTPTSRNGSLGPHVPLPIRYNCTPNSTNLAQENPQLHRTPICLSADPDCTREFHLHYDFCQNLVSQPTISEKGQVEEPVHKEVLPFFRTDPDSERVGARGKVRTNFCPVRLQYSALSGGERLHQSIRSRRPRQYRTCNCTIARRSHSGHRYKILSQDRHGE